ncbi:MAG: hypothetical protein Q8N99_07165 [Nanoarchaeota archaeon]|nr:hypothetical protein [Nanoarchaeota archaeon]
MQEQIPEPLAVIPLDKGLELRVEPPFFYTNVVEHDGFLRTFRKTHLPEQTHGSLDVSVYQTSSEGGRLCLPEHYCRGIEGRSRGVIWTPSIDKTLDEHEIKPIFFPIIRSLAQAMPPELVRVYEIKDTDINSNDFNLGEYSETVKVEHGVHKNVSHVLIFSPENYNLELVENFWLRHYPPNRICGKTICSNFAIFFVEPKQIEEFKKIYLKYAVNHSIDPSSLSERSEARIGNAAYGYKMRVNISSLDIGSSELSSLIEQAVNNPNLSRIFRRALTRRFVRNKTLRARNEPAKPVKRSGEDRASQHQEYFFRVVSPEEAQYHKQGTFRKSLEKRRSWREFSGIRETNLNGVVLEDISTALIPETIEQAIMTDYNTIFRDAHRRFSRGPYGDYPDLRGRNIVAKLQLYNQEQSVNEKSGKGTRVLVGYAIKHKGKSKKAERIKQELKQQGFERFQPDFNPLRGIKADGTPGPVWTEKLFSRNHTLTDLRPWSYEELKEMVVKQ